MSLTSYRAAPPRVNSTANADRAARIFAFVCPQRLRLLRADRVLLHPASKKLVRNDKGRLRGPSSPKAGRNRKEKTCNLQTWQRPTLPCLKTKYHRRWGVSRPSSEWDRVQPPRQNHQVSKVHVISRSWSFPSYPIIRWALAMRTIKPIELLVPVSYTHCCASTPGLSTWWSSTTLEGELVLRWVSRLDAFSGYPVRT